MNPLSFLFASLVFIGWGVSVFFDKLTTTRLGQRGLWLWLLGFIPALAIYLPVYFLSHRFGFDRQGVLFLILSSIFNISALVFYYLLLLRTDLSTAGPLVALYPALTTILAFAFLHEAITPAKIAGLILSLAAIYLLSR